MYVPKYFEETRVPILHDLIVAHPFGTLVTLNTAGRLDANHIPFEIDQEPAPFGTLRGHIARANPLWRDIGRNSQVLAVFQGPNAYISPAWYPTKKETGKVVPTWNYAVVHARGPMSVIHETTWLYGLVERLTMRNEGKRPTPWKITDAPKDYIEQLLTTIVGLEIRIEELVGKWKVSQNRVASDRDGTAAGLLEEGTAHSNEIARLIREHSQ